jgi:hypothetical protein
MKKPPCKKNGQDCPKRCPGCQPRCPDYAAYRATLQKEAEARTPDYIANAATKASVRRMAKRNPIKRALVYNRAEKK